MKESTAFLHVRTLANFSIAATVCAVLATTLFPYDFTTQAYEHQIAPFLNPRIISFRSIEEDIVINLILFVPIGFAFSILTSRRKLRVARAFTLVLLAGGLLSLVVEVLQLFLPSRHSSLFDVASNTVGTAVGFALHRLSARFVRESLAKTLSKDSERRSTTLLAVGSFLYLAFFLLISIPLQQRAIVGKFDLESSPLLLGNEVTGDRPWIGSFERLAIADYAFSPEEVEGFFARNRPRKLLAYYTFHGPAPFADETGNNARLEWSRTDSLEASGAQTTATRWLQTPTPAAVISRRIEEAKQFTLCVRASSMKQEQMEYARIVSASSDVWHRNFAIVTIGNGIGIRFRARTTGVNGTNPQFVIPEVFNDTLMHSVVVVLNGSFLSVYIDTVERVYTMNLGPGFALFNRFIPSNGRLNIANPTKHFHNLLFAIIMFIPFAYVTSLIIRQLKLRFAARRLIACAAFILPPLLLEIVLQHAAQRTFDVHNMLLPIVLMIGTAGLVAFSNVGKRSNTN